MTLVAMRHRLSAIAALALVTAIVPASTSAIAQTCVLVVEGTKVGILDSSPVRKGTAYVAPATKGGTASAHIYRPTTGQSLVRRSR